MDRITGTLIHYAPICPRKIWLMAHELNPDEDHPSLELGRFLSEQAYPRQRRRQITLPGMVLDWVEEEGEQLLVAEVKKSSRALPAARLQLLFYLQRLEEAGLRVRG
ncbi:MAG TPA: Dna2/Cas4 domain-containing protein, partial [Armatimonadetes bacterium]|nr:Dna2/Cas4 domain-containing protein [Armatimonadota bacterium]